MDRRSSTLLNSARPSASPPLQPTDDAIEAIIQQATSARPPSEGRPLRDTRTQLFIGNLPYRVRWQDLKDLFRKAGTVLRADVSLGPDNRSRGYGTVLLATAEDAGRAVDMFNGYSWQTRILEVRLDRLLPEYDSQLLPMGNSTSAPSSSSPPYPPFASTSSHSGTTSSVSDEPDYISMHHGSDPNSCRNLFVGNLPFHCQWQDLKDLFRQAGTILRADVALGPDGRSRGFGTVVFATEYDAERAVNMFNGYEYNNRVLKVHYDKFTQASLPATTSASPAVGASTLQNLQIKLPPGFMFDYEPMSGPSSPYEMRSQLQYQQQHQQARMLHQPQAQHYQHHPMHLQQRQQQQQQQHLHSPFNSTHSKLDVDSLTNTLASTHLSRPSQPQTLSTHKPSPISTTTSSGSTTTTSSSSDHSRTSTSASSVSDSPIQAQSHQPQTQHHQHQNHPHSHAHHPGPISLPPLRPPTFPISPHTPQASGMSLSPLHHPSMGSPYHLYPSSSAIAYQQHPQMVPLTPHGLPPITPSMPPFTFLPPSHAMMSHQQQQQHPVSASIDTSAAAAGSASGRPPHTSASAAGTSSSASTGSSIPYPSGNNPQQQQHQHQHQQQQHAFATPNQAFIIPLPSPGLYSLAPQHQHQQPLPSPPIHHHQSHLRLNLSGIPGAFSPGVAMSPGTFYGRPRDVVPNTNPFINAAVGAPVHTNMHSPVGVMGGMPPSVGVMHGHAHVTHGAYFYAMSSPTKGPPTGMEPKGYFDPMYFPVGSVTVGGSGLVHEIMQDRDGLSSEEIIGREKEDDKTNSSETVAEGAGAPDTAESGGDSSPSADASVSAGTGTRTTSATSSSSASSLTSWYTNERDRKPSSADEDANGESSSSSDTMSEAVAAAVSPGLSLDEGSTISRTHSVGHTRKVKHAPAEATPVYLRGQSDPILGSAIAIDGTTSDEGSSSGPAMPQNLESPVPLSRSHRTASMTDTVEAQTLTSSPASTSASTSTSAPSLQ